MRRLNRLNNNKQDFDKNVFINCPFDDDYKKLFKPLVFTVLYLGYNPRVASERSDSGELRMPKILEMIETSKISIHDISRISSNKKGEHYRMNMPFELGVDIGCRFFQGGLAEKKMFLVLEEKKFRYQKALSDMSGVDIKSHNNEPMEVVYQVRNWFVENDVDHADYASIIWTRFNEFMADLYKEAKRAGPNALDLTQMPTREYIKCAKDWINANARIACRVG